MEMWLWTIGVLLTLMPCFIAHKRKMANFVLIDVLSVCVSWTIVGWVVMMAWAIWGKSDPQEFAKETRGIVPKI